MFLFRSLKNATVPLRNIDSLHQRAGSKQVIEIHGTMATAAGLLQRPGEDGRVVNKQPKLPSNGVVGIFFGNI